MMVQPGTAWNRLTSASTSVPVVVSGNLLPSANITYNLGSPTQRFNSLYLSGNTIDIGGLSIKSDAGGNVAFIPASGTGFFLNSSGSTTSITPPVWVTTSSISQAANAFFYTSLTATANTAVTYNSTAGNALPAGLTLTTGGNLSGNLSAGTYVFKIDATNTFGQANTQTFSTTVNNGWTINYLVVAGGGSGGGGVGAGGGAGGLIASNVFVTGSGTLYTISIGGGGALNPNGSFYPGLPGGNSYITATTLGNIVAVGGGFGGGYSPGDPGGNGGSGGGGGSFSGSFPGGSGKTGQGNPGGAGAGPGQGYAGGGGGAGGSGGNATPSSAGAGGPGYTWTFTGNIYAGGGGGGGGYTSTPGPSGTGGAGGSGGGGTGGGDTPATSGANGNTNTGGGGGGSRDNPPSGAGGSGVIILSVPTSRYSGAYTGSNVVVTTPPAAPGQTVVTFNSSGTYTTQCITVAKQQNSPFWAIFYEQLLYNTTAINTLYIF